MTSLPRPAPAGRGFFLAGTADASGLAFAHPLDDHLIDPLQSGMLGFGGRALRTRLALGRGRAWLPVGDFIVRRGHA